MEDICQFDSRKDPQLGSKERMSFLAQTFRKASRGATKKCMSEKVSRLGFAVFLE